jgi:hypothetical protein
LLATIQIKQIIKELEDFLAIYLNKCRGCFSISRPFSILNERTKEYKSLYEKQFVIMSKGCCHFVHK